MRTVGWGEKQRQICDFGNHCERLLQLALFDNALLALIFWHSRVGLMTVTTIFVSVQANPLDALAADKIRSWRRRSKPRKRPAVFHAAGHRRDSKFGRGRAASLAASRLLTSARPRRHCQSASRATDAFAGRAARPYRLSPARWGHPRWRAWKAVRCGRRRCGRPRPSPNAAKETGIISGSSSRPMMPATIGSLRSFTRELMDQASPIWARGSTGSPSTIGTPSIPMSTSLCGATPTMVRTS